MADRPGGGPAPPAGGGGLSAGRPSRLTPAQRTALSELLRLYGVQASYLDVAGHRRRAAVETLTAVLGALGAEVAGASDLPGALRARRAELEARMIEPVLVAWDGILSGIDVRVGRRAAPSRAGVEIRLEPGGTVAQTLDLGMAPGTPQPWGARITRLPVRERVPPGCHRVSVAVGRRSAEARLIAAPRRAPQRPPGWGAFLPLASLRSSRSWGVGDLTDLETLLSWVGGLGGGLVGTPPMAAAFLEEPIVEPAPYSPASRLFWNELHLDISRLPGFDGSPRARRLVASPGFQAEIERLRTERLVEHGGVMAAKRRVLDVLAEDASRGPGAGDIERFARWRPQVIEYARFRAAMEGSRAPWHSWPSRLRGGRIRDGDVDPRIVRRHLYAQWAFEDQLAGVERTAARAGAGLLMDLPVGVHPAGYDVWRHRDSFAPAASTGAPPDGFFAGGQDWGFPPPHPQGIREDGYAYLRACLRHVLGHAAALRIDHLMGLHRLWWIPPGFDPSRGVYVRYRPQELYAVLLLEASRRGALVVGEDLGTVPKEVPRAMQRRGLARSYVVEMRVRASPSAALPRPPTVSVASLATHDMPPFAGWWLERDVDRNIELGALDRAGAGRERRSRARLRRALVSFLRARDLLDHDEPTPGEVAAACLVHLSGGPAGQVIATLEDLWEEVDPLNVPGTTTEYPNWRRRTRYSLERLRSMRGVVGTLRAVNAHREGGGS